MLPWKELREMRLRADSELGDAGRSVEVCASLICSDITSYRELGSQTEPVRQSVSVLKTYILTITFLTDSHEE